MRATIGIYEHPEFSVSEDVFGKRGMVALGAVAGVLSVAAVSAFGVYQFTSFGKTLQQSSIFHFAHSTTKA